MRTRRPSHAPWLSGAKATIIGLAAFGCVRVADPASASSSPWALAAFLLVAAALYLLISGILLVASQRPRRRKRRVGEVLVAAVAGSACGGVWGLLVATVVHAARPQAIIGPAGLAVGVVTGLSVAILLSRCTSLREVAKRSAMTTGFHSLMLPIGSLVAFVIAGAQWPPATSARPALTAVILGIRLAGNASTVGLSVGGLLLGVFLIFIGDRVLRGVTLPASKRIS